MKIQTFSGRLVNPFDLRHTDLSAIDIAESLSKQCRFNGHTKRFYSVAEHCYLASLMIRGDKRLRLAALVHDANEAYLGDWPSPLKLHPIIGPAFLSAERTVQGAINCWLGMPHDIDCMPEIHEVDQRMLATEKRDLLTEPEIPWETPFAPYPDVNLLNEVSPKRARTLWLNRLVELFVG